MAEKFLFISDVLFPNPGPGNVGAVGVCPLIFHMLIT